MSGEILLRLTDYKERIVEKATKDCQPIEGRRPRLLLIVGSFGVGKTPITEMMTLEGMIAKSSVKINPGMAIPYFKNSPVEKIRHPEFLPEYIDDYYVICQTAVQEGLNRHSDIIMADFGSFPDRINPIISMARESRCDLLAVGLVQPVVCYRHTLANNIGHPVAFEQALKLQTDMLKHWRGFFEKTFGLAVLFTYFNEHINLVRNAVNTGENETILEISQRLGSSEFSQKFNRIFTERFAEKYKRLAIKF